MLEQKITMNRTGRTTADAFGVSEERKAEILKKLIAVAGICHTYSTIAESFLECKDRFTFMERLYGLFMIGKTQGAAAMMKQLRQPIKAKEFSMPLEIKLLSLMSKDVIVEKVIMEALQP